MRQMHLPCTDVQDEASIEVVRYEAVPLIDHLAITQLRDLVGDDAWHAILHRFCDSLPVLLSEIRNAESSEALQMPAHSLRGSAMNIGLVQLGFCLEQLEAKAEAGTIRRDLIMAATDVATRSIEAASKLG